MPSILSTKKLLPNQRELLLNAGVSFVEYDAITIAPVAFEIPDNIKNVIVTSQNGAKAIQNLELRNVNFFVVGNKTATLLAKNDKKAIKIAQNGAELGDFITNNYHNESFTYFCGRQRRDELPLLLKEAGIVCNEVPVYETHQVTQIFDQTLDGVLFYSPSGVEAFAKANTLKNTTAFCIGETTADEARKHTDNVIVSNATTIESTIAKAVKNIKKL